MHELKVQLPPEVTEEEARLLLAAKLFERGRLSLGQAAHIAGYAKATFMELLGTLGVAVFDYPPDDLKDEVDEGDLPKHIASPKSSEDPNDEVNG